MNEATTSSPSIRGIKYPLEISNGNLAVSTDYDIKAQEIRSVIDTRFFERIMRADYGVGEYTLGIINPGLINSDFQRAINENVEGLSSLSVEGDWLSSGDDGIYKVRVRYAVSGVPQPPIEYSLAN